LTQLLRRRLNFTWLQVLNQFQKRSLDNIQYIPFALWGYIFLLLGRKQSSCLSHGLNQNLIL
jgi:hypothetical protein